MRWETNLNDIYSNWGAVKHHAIKTVACADHYNVIICWESSYRNCYAYFSYGKVNSWRQAGSQKTPFQINNWEISQRTKIMNKSYQASISTCHFHPRRGYRAWYLSHSKYQVVISIALYLSAAIGMSCRWHIQYIPRNMHTVFALLCFVVVIHWLIFPYPSGLLHWHCGNLTIAPVPAKQPWWIWINTSCEFIMNDCITTTKQSTKNRVHISWDILYVTTRSPQAEHNRYYNLS